MDVEVGSRTLQFFFPKLPPSENNIWIHRYQGGQTYTKEAKLYRQSFMTFMGREVWKEVQAFMRGHRPECLYRLSLVYSFSLYSVINKGWPGKAATWIKRMDTANRRKLLEDCLVESLGGSNAGMDDSLFFEVNLVKFVSEPEGVLVTLQEVDAAEFGLEVINAG